WRRRRARLGGRRGTPPIGASGRPPGGPRQQIGLLPCPDIIWYRQYRLSIGGPGYARIMSSNPGFAQAPTRQVPTRTMEFDPWLDDLPKHFAADGDVVTSHVLAVLSSVFPDGEDYFVRSVEAVRDRIEDPKLRQDVEGFIGQESMHGREHRALNERLAELGYPTRAIGTYVQKLTAFRERLQSKNA